MVPKCLIKKSIAKSTERLKLELEIGGCHANNRDIHTHAHTKRGRERETSIGGQLVSQSVSQGEEDNCAWVGGKSFSKPHKRQLYIRMSVIVVLIPRDSYLFNQTPTRSGHAYASVQYCTTK